MKYLEVKGASFVAVCYSEDGQYLVSLNSRSILRFWHLASFEQRLSVMVESVPGNFTGLTLMGSHAIFPECVRNIGAVWEWLQAPTAQKPLCPAVKLDALPYAAVIAPIPERQQILGVWNPWPRVRPIPAAIWGLDGKRISEGNAPETRLPMTVLPGGKRGAYISRKLITICELLKAEPIAELTHTDHVQILRFSVDGKLLATGAGRSVWLWNLDSKDSPTRFPAFQTYVKCVALHPRGRLLAASNKEGDVRFYDTLTLREINRFAPNIGAVHSLAFAPDGATIAAGGRGRIAVWDIDEA